MMELWDIYDVNRKKTGRVIDRNSNEKLKDGEYHLVTEAIIINDIGKILLSKRANFKQKYPLMWECTTGSCIKEETSLQAILREIKEELGLSLKETEAIFYKTLRDDEAKDFKDIWIFRKNINIKDLNFTDKEVIDAKWVTIEEFEEMDNNKEIVPTIDFTREDYTKCTKLNSKCLESIKIKDNKDLLNKLKKGMKDTDNGKVCSIEEAYEEVKKI